MRVLRVNDSKYEALSALIDGEADNAADLLKQVSSDPELKARWEAHYRAKAAMHGEYAPQLDSGFASRVSAALDSEPAILAPRGATVRKASTGNRWQRPLAGLAIAATVAAVSIIGLNNFATSPVAPAVDTVASADGTQPTITAQGVQPRAEVRRVSLTSDGGTYWYLQQADKTRDAKLEARLNMYLADHMEYANSSKVQGMLPYSRLVGYDTSE